MGAFAFADEAGTIELEFPGTKGSPKAVAPKTVHDVTGTLTVKVGGDSYQLDITGTYDDQGGNVVASASSKIGGEETEYSIEGEYTAEIGFEGEITRTTGSATATGVVGALALEEVPGLQFYVFLGSYAVTTYWEVYDGDEWEFEIYVDDGSGVGILYKAGDPSTWILTGTVDTAWTDYGAGYRIEITQHGTFVAAAQ